MKSHFFIVVLLLPLSVFSQNADTTVPAKQSKISLGVIFSPEYSYRNISTPQSQDQFIVQDRNNREIYRITYSEGLQCNYQLNNKWALSLGAIYSDKGYKTKTDNLTFGDMIDATRGFVYHTNIYSASFTYHYYYIDLPIKASYFIFKKKFKLFASAGVSINIHIADYNSITTTDSTGYATTTTDKVNNGLSLINPQAIASIGASYAISKKLYVSLEPEAAYSIIPIIQADIKEYLYSFGANAGVYWKF